MKKLGYWILATITSGLFLYGCWWLHNDYPFWTAMLAGGVVGGYHVWMLYRIKKAQNDVLLITKVGFNFLEKMIQREIRNAKSATPITGG